MFADLQGSAEKQVRAEQAQAVPGAESARRRAQAAHLGDLGSFIDQFRLRIASIHAALSPDSLAAQGRLAGRPPLAVRYHCISLQVVRAPAQLRLSCRCRSWRRLLRGAREFQTWEIIDT